MKRVMIVGQPGAGKSTTARMIAEATGLPVVYIDQIHWMDGWIEREKPEKIKLIRLEEVKDLWVIEGGLSQTWENRLDRADTLIVLDFPLWLRAWRVFWRTIKFRGQSRPDLPAGCPERFDLEFWQWIWNTRTTGKRKAVALIDKASPDTDVHHLKSPRQVRHYLSHLEKRVERG